MAPSFPTIRTADSFLSIEKMEEGRMELEMVSVSPRAVLEETLRVFTAAIEHKHIAVTIECDPSVPVFTGDYHR